MTSTQPRKPAGSPVGGEFSNKQGSPPTSVLGRPAKPRLDLAVVVSEFRPQQDFEMFEQEVEKLADICERWEKQNPGWGIVGCEHLGRAEPYLYVENPTGDSFRLTTGNEGQDVVYDDSDHLPSRGRRRPEEFDARDGVDVFDAISCLNSIHRTFGEEGVDAVSAGLGASDDKKAGGPPASNVGVFTAAQYEHAPQEVLDALDVIQVDGLVIRARQG